MALNPDLRTSKFWMVWCPAGGVPTVPHLLKDQAVKEAERLAKAHPGKDFYVLEALELRCVDNMQRVKLVEEEPPF